MAAEFFGHCQICGREHKASAASIATHGYTIRNGWQEGACYGSGGKPIEVSCDLIEGGIAAAKRYIERTKQEIAKLAQNPLWDRGMITMLVRRTTRKGQLIYPIHVRIELNAKGEPVAIGEDGKKEKSWPSYTGIKTVEAAAEELGNMRIGYLTKTIDETNESIEYLTERVKNWKPSPLRPVTDADRATSAPKVHFAAKRYGYNSTICASSAMGAQRLSGSRTTENREEVTCAACLKALNERDELPAKRAAEAEKERQRKIKDLEKSIKEFTKWIKNGSDDPMAVVRWTEMMNRDTAELEEFKAAAPKE